MKRIIPIFLIIVIISCIVLPFAVSAELSQFSYVNITNFNNILSNQGNTFIPITPITIDYYYTGSNISPVSGSIVVNYVQLVHVSFGNVNDIRFCTNTDNNSGTNYVIRLSSTGNIYSYTLNNSGLLITGNNNFGSFLILNQEWNYSNQTYISQAHFSRDFNSSEIGFEGFYIQSNYSLSYTLTFNSNGGSSIAPITDIEPNSTINLVDQFGFYLPQFIPTFGGFIFDYWYEIDHPLTPVTRITVTEDIILNAKYTHDSTYQYINFTSGFYHDAECTSPISARVNAEIGSTYTCYLKASTVPDNFYGQITLDGTNYSKEYTGTEVGSGVYQYNLTVPSVETTVNVLSYESLDCTLYVFGGIWNDYVGNVYINGTPVLTEQQVVHFDGYTGIHLEFDMYPPYVITDIVFTDVLYGPFSYELTFNVSDTIVEMVGGDWGFYTHVDAYCYPNQDGVIQVWNRSITEYDITSRAPIIVYDESGNASWAFSEVDVMDTDWSQVQENIPRKLFGIFDGLFTLEGLAVLIPVIMMVSFTVWFLRRS